MCFDYPKEHIQYLSMEALQSANESKLTQVLKDYGLYEKYQSLYEKYDIENLYHTYLNWCLLTAGTSVQDNKSLSGSVGYDPFKGKWQIAAAVGVARVRPNDQTIDRHSVITYMRQALKRIFIPMWPRNEDSYWYCSKVVYRGWKDGISGESYELEPHYYDWSNLTIPWLWTPSLSWKFVEFGKGKKVFKIWYPVLDAWEVPDAMALPQNLWEDDDVSSSALSLRRGSI